MNILRKATVLGRKKTINSRSAPVLPSATHNTSSDSISPEKQESTRQDTDTPTSPTTHESNDPWKPDTKETPIVAKMRKADGVFNTNLDKMARLSTVNASPKSIRASTSEAKNIRTSVVGSGASAAEKQGPRVVVPLKGDDVEADNASNRNSTSGLERSATRSYRGSRDGLGSSEKITRSRDGLGSKEGISGSRSREGLATITRPEFAVASLEATEKALREQIAILNQENKHVKNLMIEERRTVEQALKSRDLLIEKLAKVEAELDSNISNYKQKLQALEHENAINNVKSKQEKSAAQTKSIIEQRSADKQIKSLTEQLEKAKERIIVLEQLNQALEQKATNEGQVCSVCKSGLNKSLLQSLLESTTSDAASSELAQKMRLIDSSAAFDFSASSYTENAINKFEITEVASQLAKSLNELSTLFESGVTASSSLMHDKNKEALVRTSQEIAKSLTRLNEAAAGEDALKVDMFIIDELGESKIDRIEDSAVSQVETPQYVKEFDNSNL